MHNFFDTLVQVLSADKKFFSDDAFKEHFVKFEGQKIAMPERFLPSQDLLSKHREHLTG